jgi:hypothetical protein
MGNIPRETQAHSDFWPLVTAFEEGTVEVFGERARRFWPSSMDQVHASRALAAGITAEQVKAETVRRQQLQLENKRRPIRNFQWIIQGLEDEQLAEYAEQQERRRRYRALANL